MRGRLAAGWQPARRLATAAVRRKRGSWPIDNRPDPEGTHTQLPHKSVPCLAYTYTQIQSVLLMNRAGRLLRPPLHSVRRAPRPPRRQPARCWIQMFYSARHVLRDDRCLGFWHGQRHFLRASCDYPRGSGGGSRLKFFFRYKRWYPIGALLFLQKV